MEGSTVVSDSGRTAENSQLAAPATAPTTDSATPAKGRKKRGKARLTSLAPTSSSPPADPGIGVAVGPPVGPPEGEDETRAPTPAGQPQAPPTYDERTAARAKKDWTRKFARINQRVPQGAALLLERLSKLLSQTQSQVLELALDALQDQCDLAFRPDDPEAGYAARRIRERTDCLQAGAKVVYKKVEGEVYSDLAIDPFKSRPDRARTVCDVRGRLWQVNAGDVQDYMMWRCGEENRLLAGELLLKAKGDLANMHPIELLRWDCQMRAWSASIDERMKDIERGGRGGGGVTNVEKAAWDIHLKAWESANEAAREAAKNMHVKGPRIPKAAKALEARVGPPKADELPPPVPAPPVMATLPESADALAAAMASPDKWAMSAVTEPFVTFERRTQLTVEETKAIGLWWDPEKRAWFSDDEAAARLDRVSRLIETGATVEEALDLVGVKLQLAEPPDDRELSANEAAEAGAGDWETADALFGRPAAAAVDVGKVAEEIFGEARHDDGNDQPAR